VTEGEKALANKQGGPIFVQEKRKKEETRKPRHQRGKKELFRRKRGGIFESGEKGAELCCGKAPGSRCKREKEKKKKSPTFTKKEEKGGEIRPRRLWGGERKSKEPYPRGKRKKLELVHNGKKGGSLPDIQGSKDIFFRKGKGGNDSFTPRQKRNGSR